MNTLEIDHVLKTHPITRHVFKGVYARNRLPISLSEPSALIGNTDPYDRPGTHWVALCIDANSRGEYYDPTGRPPFLRAYVNFMNKHCTSWTYNPSEFKKKAPLYADNTVYFIWYTDVPENPWVMLREHWDTRKKPSFPVTSVPVTSVPVTSADVIFGDVTIPHKCDLDGASILLIMILSWIFWNPFKRNH